MRELAHFTYKEIAASGYLKGTLPSENLNYLAEPPYDERRARCVTGPRREAPANPVDLLNNAVIQGVLPLSSTHTAGNEVPSYPKR